VLDIIKDFLFHWNPSELYALPDDVRQYDGAFSESRNKLGDVLDKAIEGPDFG